MDIEEFVATHQPQWDRLRQLCAHSGRLSGREADEVVDLYQRTSTHLATLRGSAYAPELEAQLSTLLANARAVITGTAPTTLRNIVRFVTATLPAALYQIRYEAIAVAVASVLLMMIVALNVIQHPEIPRAYMTQAQIDMIVNYQFAAYYSENPASSWAFTLWLHNSEVAAMSLLLGVLVIPTLGLLYGNALNVGLMAGLLIGHGRGDVFWGLILPHGMLELTAIFFASAAGLRVAWSWIAPGPRPRARALAETGRRLVIVAVGTFFWLLVSGCIEAFVTPSGLPAAARVGIGFVAVVAFWCYVLILGKRAVAGGVTGDVDEATLNATQPIEAAV